MNAVLLKLVRVVLPLGIAVAGLVAIIAGHANPNNTLAAAGVALLIVALIVWMINWMYRLSMESNVDREREELAREYFDRTGHWPGEEPNEDAHGEDEYGPDGEDDYGADGEGHHGEDDYAEDEHDRG